MPREVKIKHVHSEQHRTALIDNGVAVSIGDTFGVQIFLTLSRMDAVTLSETVRLEDNGGISLIEGTVPESENRRLLEFTAVIRPNHAKILISLLQNTLRRLPLNVRNQYGITDADLGPGGAT